MRTPYWETQRGHQDVLGFSFGIWVVLIVRFVCFFWLRIRICTHVSVIIIAIFVVVMRMPMILASLLPADIFTEQIQS